MKKRSPAVDYATVVAGTFLTGSTIKNIYDPVSMVINSVSGVAIVAKELQSVPLRLTNTALSIPLPAAGLSLCGQRFIERTFLVMVMLSVSLYVLPEASYLGGDPFLSVLFRGIIGGVETGLVLLAGCTAGGTDLLVVLIQKRLKCYTLARIMQMLDGLIMAAGTFVFGVRAVLYVLAAASCVAKVTDSLTGGLEFSKRAYIISEHYREITEAIVKQMGGGVTNAKARGMCSDQEKRMLFCMVSEKEIMRLKEIVAEFGSNASIIISDVREVFGREFIEYQALSFVIFADVFWSSAAD